jgi:hypothetical protein
VEDKSAGSGSEVVSLVHLGFKLPDDRDFEVSVDGHGN